MGDKKYTLISASLGTHRFQRAGSAGGALIRRRRSGFSIRLRSGLHAGSDGREKAYPGVSRFIRSLASRKALITAPLGPTLCHVQIVNRANLPIETLTALERELPRFGTLQEFVLWGARERPPVLLVETIALDEYTHDVIAPWRAQGNGLTLVLEST